MLYYALLLLMLVVEGGGGMSGQWREKERGGDRMGGRKTLMVIWLLIALLVDLLHKEGHGWLAN